MRHAEAGKLLGTPLLPIYSQYRTSKGGLDRANKPEPSAFGKHVRKLRNLQEGEGHKN